METVPWVAFEYHLAPLLDGRDAARLRRVSKTMRNLVDSSRYLTRRRRQHYIWLDDPGELQELLSSDLELVGDVPYQTFALLLHKKPAVEHIMEVKCNVTGARWLITDHYEEHSRYRNAVWDEVDRNTQLIEFKTLGNCQRLRLGTHITVHRGGCVIVRIL